MIQKKNDQEKLLSAFWLVSGVTYNVSVLAPSLNFVLFYIIVFFASSFNQFNIDNEEIEESTKIEFMAVMYSVSGLGALGAFYVL